MGRVSKIEWTDATWNPVTGCTKVSEGCRHCYAEAFAERWRGVDGHPYEQGFDLRLWPERLEMPLHWRKPRLIFVNSMSDLFHELVPLTYLHDVFDVMRRAHWHTFQVLTKRAMRLRLIAPKLDWPPNVWMGVTVEKATEFARIDALRATNARIKFLCLEPLLGPLSGLDLTGIDWVIAGGESGPKSRPPKEEWVRSVRDRCREASVPFFFKQWGGSKRDKGGRVLDGRTWDELPEGIPT